MSKAVLIDFDGVLRHWPEYHIAEVEKEFGLPAGTIPGTAFAPDLIEPVIVGEIADEVWRARIVDRLRETYPTFDCQGIVDAWSEPSGEIDQEVLDIVEACRATATVTLVTNATSRLRADLDRLGISEAFDQVVNSSEVGVTKPGGEIFEHALKVSGATPSTALFVDDKEENVKGAESVGIVSHLFEGVEGLRGFLGELGVIGGKGATEITESTEDSGNAKP